MTFIDGSRITPGTEKCMCDSTVPLPFGQQRDCEFPCWQRLGLTSSPCCPDCAPLPEPGDA
jgi:hypothetical protein